MAEAASFSVAELALVTGVRRELGEAIFCAVPADTLCCFVRRYAERGVPELAALLRSHIEWRSSSSRIASAVALRAPAKRAAFEKAYSCGPVGRDARGHPVILERVGQLDPAAFSAYGVDELRVHAAYAREAARVLCREASHACGRRVYKTVVIIDLLGIGSGHADLVPVLRTHLEELQHMCAAGPHRPPLAPSLAPLVAPAPYSRRHPHHPHRSRSRQVPVPPRLAILDQHARHVALGVGSRRRRLRVSAVDA